MFTIRPCETHDYEAIARIHNAIQPEPTTALQLQRSDETLRSQPGTSLARLVVEDQGGQVVAYGFAERVTWQPPGQWFVKAMVAPGARRRGIGKALYQQARQIAVEGGATMLETWVRGEDHESRAWAERQGFVLDRERTESVLDLTNFDLSRFAGAVERVEESGLRLAVHTEVDDALLRQIWELDVTTMPDVPIVEPDETPPTFEEYERYWRNEVSERVVAGCFDGDRLVSVSILHLPLVAGAGAYTGFTGTYREYRGRGVALAVKLLTIREAIARSVARMRTNNDPDNPPMLAVNEKLGYQLIPGPCRYKMPV
ncbi:MAG: GNAT family N-acetyltransferase [Bacillota bacterium]